MCVESLTEALKNCEEGGNSREERGNSREEGAGRGRRHDDRGLEGGKKKEEGGKYILSVFCNQFRNLPRALHKTYFLASKFKSANNNNTVSIINDQQVSIFLLPGLRSRQEGGGKYFLSVSCRNLPRTASHKN